MFQPEHVVSELELIYFFRVLEVGGSLSAAHDENAVGELHDLV